MLALGVISDDDSLVYFWHAGTRSPISRVSGLVFFPKCNDALTEHTLAKDKTSDVQNIFLSGNTKHLSKNTGLLDASGGVGNLPNSNFVVRQISVQSLIDLAWITYEDRWRLFWWAERRLYP